MKPFLLLGLVLWPLLAGAQTPTAPQPLPIADVHFHLMRFMTPEDLGARMARHHIRWVVSAGAIGSPQLGNSTYRDGQVRKVLGARFVPAVGGSESYVAERTEGTRLYTDPQSTERFLVLDAVESLVGKEQRSIAETFPNAERSSLDPLRRRRVPTDSLFFRELMAIAEKTGTPVPMHMEWHPESVAQLGKLLTEFAKGTVVLSHCGKTTTADDIRKFLVQYPNVFCDLGYRSAPQATDESRSDPLRMIFWGGAFMRSAGLKPEWLQLVEDHPDRFMVAIDDVTSWEQFDEVVTAIRTGLLDKLTPATAEKVAFRNAVRVYRLTAP